MSVGGYWGCAGCGASNANRVALWEVRGWSQGTKLDKFPRNNYSLLLFYQVSESLNMFPKLKKQTILCIYYIGQLYSNKYREMRLLSLSKLLDNPYRKEIIKSIATPNFLKSYNKRLYDIV